MKADPLFRERRIIAGDAFVELVVWRLPAPVPGSAHPFKYRLALVVDGTCILRYDNEAGKGDHRHAGNQQTPYTFITPEQLLADFWRDVERWRP